MADKRPDRDLDVAQNALRVVREATGQQPKSELPPEKNPHAVALGKLGGRKGGLARAKNLRKKELSAIGRMGGKKRWGKRRKKL